MKIERLNQLLLSLSAAGAVALAPLAVNSQTAPDQPPQEPPAGEPDERTVEDPADAEVTRELMNQIRERDDMNEIASILETIDLDAILEGGSHTFFLPTDDAFADLEEAEGAGTISAATGDTELEAFVRGHIARGVHSAQQLRDEGASSLAEHRIEGGRDLLLRTVVRPVNAEGESVGEDARLVESDIEVAEGMLHVVNRAWVDLDQVPTGQAVEDDADAGGYEAVPRDDGDEDKREHREDKDKEDKEENDSDAEEDRSNNEAEAQR